MAQVRLLTALVLNSHGKTFALQESIWNVKDAVRVKARGHLCSLVQGQRNLKNKRILCLQHQDPSLPLQSLVRVRGGKSWLTSLLVSHGEVSPSSVFDECWSDILWLSRCFPRGQGTLQIQLTPTVGETGSITCRDRWVTARVQRNALAEADEGLRFIAVTSPGPGCCCPAGASRKH